VSLLTQLATEVLVALASSLLSAVVQGGVNIGTGVSFGIFFLGAAFINRQEAITKIITRRGNWEPARHFRSTWTYDDLPAETSEPPVHGNLRIRVVGSYIWGKGTGRRTIGSADERFEYRVNGGLNHEGLVAGSWRSILPGKNYYGHFQLSLAREGEFHGKWMGVAQGNIVRSGTWTWEPVEEGPRE
jgi:hypothetical protein